MAYRREKGIADDRKKPRLRVISPKPVKAPIGAQYRLLNDVVGLRRRTREPARKIVGRVYVRQHLRLKSAAPVIHGDARSASSDNLLGHDSVTHGFIP
jgi:hypothetical protein